MSWQGRIRQAKYTSPGGVAHTFAFEDLSESIPLHNNPVDFPDVDGTYVQPLGVSGRRYPVAAIFSGDDYDQQAKAYVDALLEPGRGRLEHPIYGTHDVVPVGKVDRDDRLKTAANVGVVTTEFVVSIADLFPESQADSDASLEAGLDAQKNGAAGQLAEDVDTETPSALSALKSAASTALAAVKAGVGAVAETQADIARAFDTVARTIDNTLDTLIRDPINLALEFDRLAQLPAQTLATFEARLDGYKNIISGFTGTDRTPSNGNESTNAFAQNLQTCDACLAAVFASTLNAEFTNRLQATDAATNVVALFDQLNDWRDRNSQTLGRIDTGGSYQPLQATLAITVNALLTQAFNLPTQITITLDGPRTPLDLCAELYQELDTGEPGDKLDLLIESNGIQGDELFELPQGRRIVYYRA